MLLLTDHTLYHHLYVVMISLFYVGFRQWRIMMHNTNQSLLATNVEDRGGIHCSIGGQKQPK